MFHFCYLTRNKINDKIYFGKHSTTNVNDGYLGSGKLLTVAIQKYGKDNFEVVDRWFFDNEDLAYEYEADIVNENFIARDDVYNLQLGGHTASHTKHRSESDNYRIGKKAMTNGDHTLYVPIDDIPQYLKDGYKLGRTLLSKSKDPKQKRKGCNRAVIIITPEGEEVTVTHYTNFCKENDLDIRQFSKLVNDKMYKHKGYTKKGSTFTEYKQERKQIQTPDGVFLSLTECAEYYNLKEDAVYNRVYRSKSQKWSEWRYI